jgi:translation initiation factor IF-3
VPGAQTTRINEAIRAETVRLIDHEGENRGEVRLADAQEIANSLSLDLVEVAAEARPPVVRIMDYGKWRYEQEQKAKQARKHQNTITVKEIKFRPKIDPHDYDTKKGHVIRFLKHRDKVKVTIMFRGRELIHPERGEAILLRLAEEVKEFGAIESRPNLDGRNMIMMLAPLRSIAGPPIPGGSGGSAPQQSDEPAGAQAEDAPAAEAEDAPVAEAEDSPAAQVEDAPAPAEPAPDESTPTPTTS